MNYENNYLLLFVIICFAALGCSTIRDLASKARGGETNSNSAPNSGGSSKGGGNGGFRSEGKHYRGV